MPTATSSPPAHAEQAHALEELATDCALDFDGGRGWAAWARGRGQRPVGEGSGALTPVAVENFRMLKERQTADSLVSGGSKKGRVNLLNWDGKGMPDGLFPREKGE
jgi:nitrate reductase beta subunit